MSLVKVVLVEYDTFFSIIARLYTSVYQILFVVILFSIDDVHLAGDRLFELFVGVFPTVSDLRCCRVVVFLPFFGDYYF